MKNWQHVWRFALAGQISTAALEALRLGLLRNDHRLVQGRTTVPPALESMEREEVEGACALGFCGWQGEKLGRVGQVQDYYHRLCQKADAVLGEPGISSLFLNWFDEAPRSQMRRELLAEVNWALQCKLIEAA